MVGKHPKLHISIADRNDLRDAPNHPLQMGEKSCSMLSCDLSRDHTMQSPDLGSVESFPYHYILLGFVAYYGAESILKEACRWRQPSLYAQLEAHSQLVPFFGFCMGWLITLFSTPICAYAFLDQQRRENPRMCLYQPILQLSGFPPWLTLVLLQLNHLFHSSRGSSFPKISCSQLYQSPARSASPPAPSCGYPSSQD